MFMRKKGILFSIFSLILLIGISVMLWFTSSLPLQLYNYEGCTVEVYYAGLPYRSLTEEETARFVAIIESAELSFFGFIDDTQYVGGPVEYIIHLKCGFDITIEMNRLYLIYNGRSFACDEATHHAIAGEFYG